MKLSLLHKMNLVVGGVAAIFVALIAVNMYLGSLSEMQRAAIRDNYIPMIELSYRLEAQFESIGLNLRDAVSSQEHMFLDDAVKAKNDLLTEIEKSSRIVQQEDVKVMKAAVESYFNAALATSKSMMNGETGEHLVTSMTEMQSKRAAAQAALNKVAKFDRSKLNEAFESITEIQRKNALIAFWVSLFTVALIVLIAFVSGRSLIARLNVISGGLEHFGQGNFKERIPETGNDELAVLSSQVNAMADKIQSLVREIEAFSFSVAHDLRAPVRGILGFSSALKEDFGDSLSDDAKTYLNRIINAAQKMGVMIDGLLGLSRLNRATVTKLEVNLSTMAAQVCKTLQESDPGHKVQFEVAENVQAKGDPKLVDIVLTNLISNSWKFSRHTPAPVIQFGSKHENQETVFFVRDNGAGFDMNYKDKLFGTFQRLHNESEFEGYGIGLATVKRIIDKHGGRIWAESEPNKGATFYFTLGL